MTSVKRIYSFSQAHSDGNASMKQLLGGKGANCAEMASIGLAVPPGFTITTQVRSTRFRALPQASNVESC